MGIEELIDTQYAFPIAGVLVCAFVVFAFGFKSTVQPPTYDYLDDKKRTSGKGKRKKEKKAQVNGIVEHKNGDIPSAASKEKTEPKSSESTAETNQKKNTKTQKSPKKVKSVSASTDEQSNLNNIQKKLQVENEDQGEGWTEQLSKKEKKNRKNKDTSPSTIEKTSPLVESNKLTENKKSKSKKNILPVEKKEENVADTTKETSQSDKENEKVDVIEKAPVIEEVPQTNKSKKKKKTVKENNATNEEKLTEKLGVKVPEKPSKNVKKDDNTEIPVKTDKSSKVDDVKENSTHEKPSNADTNTSSNVAFDELGDYWTEAPQTKKKKKARRDH